MAKMETKKRSARPYFFWTAWPRPGTAQPEDHGDDAFDFHEKHLNGIARSNQ